MDALLSELRELAQAMQYQVNIEKDTLDLVPVDHSRNPSDTLTVRLDERGIRAAIYWLRRKSHKLV